MTHPILWKLRIVTLDYTLGTVPMDPNVYATYIASLGEAEGVDTSDELETVPIAEEKGWTGFHMVESENGEKVPALMNYMIKGYLKEAGYFRRKHEGDALEISSMRAYRKNIAGLVHVRPRYLQLHIPEIVRLPIYDTQPNPRYDPDLAVEYEDLQAEFEEKATLDEYVIPAGSDEAARFERYMELMMSDRVSPEHRTLTGYKLEPGQMGYLERSLRVQTAQGERTSLCRSNTVPPGTWLHVFLRCDGQYTRQMFHELLEYGSRHGLGQWRNADYGRFNYEVVEEYDAVEDWEHAIATTA